MRNVKLLSIILIAAFILPLVPCNAQEISFPLPLTNKQKTMAGVMIGPVFNEFFNNYHPGALGVGFIMNPMFKDAYQKELGITQEQLDALMEGMKTKIMGDETLEQRKEILDALEARIGENDEDVVLTEEEINAMSGTFSAVFQGMSEVANEVFTPEQMIKIQEAELATFGGIDSPFLNVQTMGVLDLTDEQKKELEDFQADFADDKLEMLDDIGMFTKKFLKTGKMTMADIKELDEKTKEMQAKVSERVREILTDDQITKANIIVRKQQAFMAKMAGGMGSLTKWMPGLDSWAPGMPIPDSLKPAGIRKSGLFPRAKPKPEDE